MGVNNLYSGRLKLEAGPLRRHKDKLESICYNVVFTVLVVLVVLGVPGDWVGAVMRLGWLELGNPLGLED